MQLVRKETKEIEQLALTTPDDRHLSCLIHPLRKPLCEPYLSLVFAKAYALPVIHRICFSIPVRNKNKNYTIVVPTSFLFRFI